MPSDALRTRLLAELEQIRLIDPHSHIDPHAAASSTLADILGYHYYTELAHSAGLPKREIEPEADGGQPLDPKEKVARLVPSLAKLHNTVQVSWLVELCREFYGLGTEIPGDRVDESNWEAIYDRSLQRMQQPDYEQQVLDQSLLDGVFLTNDFDDPLEGFDTTRYVPCLRTDDLVFKLGDPKVRERLESASGVSLSDAASLRQAIGNLFDHFVSHGAKACAISLPPDFAPEEIGDTEIDEQIAVALKNEFEWDELNAWVFWRLAEQCHEHKLPFDLMIGVNRGVYESGVHQGRDLYNRQTSLQQYGELFNAFPQVTFPVSVLDHTANAELVSYAWIFPNVVASGHWWYSNLPGYIEQDTRVRLEGIPGTKIIGYYSDMYKLEFALPKFRMYREMLARVLAREFVEGRGWSEAEAVALGRQVLRGNVETIFGV